VAIIGRPNVGKSTLLNHILGQKISITSRKPQTTRNRILGIKTEQNVQAIYVDTPGLHSGSRQAMNRLMNSAALDTMSEVDVVVFVIEALRWQSEDDRILARLGKLGKPVFLVINKIDLVSDKSRLLHFIDGLRNKGRLEQVIPLVARRKTQVKRMEREIEQYLPLSDFYYPEDQITDRSERFLCAEFIREQLMDSLGQELPYHIAVEIENFSRSGKMVQISGVVWIERASHRPIILGKKGERLKQVATQARLEIERMLGCKVFLEMHVRVRKGWSTNEDILRSLGYGK